MSYVSHRNAVARASRQCRALWAHDTPSNANWFPRSSRFNFESRTGRFAGTLAGTLAGRFAGTNAGAIFFSLKNKMSKWCLGPPKRVVGGVNLSMDPSKDAIPEL